MTPRNSLACFSAPGANNQRQKPGMGGDKRLDHDAVGRDHADAAALLPERKGLPLANCDVQAVGIELQHGRVGDPWIGLQLRARVVGIEKQQRRAAGDAGDGENFFARHLLLAGKRDGRNVKAGGIGKRVTHIPDLRRHGVDMAASDGAIAGAGQKDRERGGDSGATRNINSRVATRRRMTRLVAAPVLRLHQRLSEASSIIHRTNSSNVIPA